MQKKSKSCLRCILGTFLLLGSANLHANAIWQGTGSTTSTDLLETNTNWSGGAGPTSSTIAEFGAPGGTTPSDLYTDTGISALGILFDAGAPAYYLNNESDYGNINIGLAGVVNNSSVAQTIATDSSFSGSIIFAGGSSGINMHYPLYNELTNSGVVFMTGTTGNGSFSMNSAGNTASITNVSGNSSIGSLNGASTASVVLAGGSLTTGSLNGDDYFYGVISGPGALALSTTTEDGSLGLGNTNTYTGGTIINAVGYGGMDILSGASLASTGPIAVNSGFLYLENISAPQTTGSLSGTGTGTIQLGAVNGLTVNQTTNQTYAGTFVGPAGASFTLGTSGSTTAIGILRLTGDSSTYAGSVGVSSGNLQVNGNLGASSITVNSGAILSGTGIFGTSGNTTTIGSGGILSPGNSVGVITNAGNQVFSAGSIFNLEENGFTTGPITPSIDLLIVDGTTTVNAATVNLVTTNGLINFNTKQTFLTSDGALNVNNGGFVLNTSFLSPLFNPEAYQSALSYDSNNYYILTQTTFTSEAINNGANANEITIGEQLDSIMDPTTPQNVFLNELAKLSSADLIDVLDDLSGAQYATGEFIAEISNRQFIRRLYDPLREIVTTEPCPDYCCSPADSCCGFSGFDAWAEAGGGQRRVNGHVGLKLDEWDITVGVQKTFSQDWTLGIAGSYEHNTIGYHSSNGSAKGYTWFGGLYGLYRPACYYVLADIAYGYTQHKVHRHVVIGDVIDAFTAKPEISQVTFYVEAGIDYNLCSFLIQPFLGIEVAGSHRNAFSERDIDASDLALNIHKRSRTIATSSLGVHLTDQFCSGYNISIDLAWLYRFSDDGRFSANFESFGTDFNVHGTKFGRSSAEGAVTFSKDYNDNWRFYVEASGEIWNKASSYNVLGGLQYTW